MNRLTGEARSDRLSGDFPLWAMMALYAAARVLQVFRGPIPMLAVVILHVAPPAGFALVHGARLYGWRGIAIFIALCLAVGNIFENAAILTGFPFGHYTFTGLMGPRLFQVPILLGLAYVGMAYLSWIAAGLILGELRAPLAGWRVITLPLVASFVMVAWDLSMDAVWSTVLHAWIWLQGGTYFGVPVTNFLGWYLTVYVFYQWFAFYSRRRPMPAARMPRGYWKLAVFFYALSAAGNLVFLARSSSAGIATDAAGVPWRVSDIIGACVLVSIFCMGGFALLAWARLPDDEGREEDSPAEGTPGQEGSREGKDLASAASRAMAD